MQRGGSVESATRDSRLDAFHDGDDEMMMS